MGLLRGPTNLRQGLGCICDSATGKKDLDSSATIHDESVQAALRTKFTSLQAVADSPSP